MIFQRKSKGLFHAAIIQSGPIDFPGLKLDQSKPLIDIHQNFATKLGCGANEDVVKCLRSKSAKEIISNYNSFDQCNGKLLTYYVVPNMMYS